MQYTGVPFDKVVQALKRRAMEGSTMEPSGGRVGGYALERPAERQEMQKYLSAPAGPGEGSTYAPGQGQPTAPPPVTGPGLAGSDAELRGTVGEGTTAGFDIAEKLKSAMDKIGDLDEEEKDLLTKLKLVKFKEPERRDIGKERTAAAVVGTIASLLGARNAPQAVGTYVARKERGVEEQYQRDLAAEGRRVGEESRPLALDLERVRTARGEERGDARVLQGQLTQVKAGEEAREAQRQAAEEQLQRDIKLLDLDEKSKVRILEKQQKGQLDLEEMRGRNRDRNVLVKAGADIVGVYDAALQVGRMAGLSEEQARERAWLLATAEQEKKIKEGAYLEWRSKEIEAKIPVHVADAKLKTALAEKAVEMTRLLPITMQQEAAYKWMMLWLAGEKLAQVSEADQQQSKTDLLKVYGDLAQKEKDYLVYPGQNATKEEVEAARTRLRTYERIIEDLTKGVATVPEGPEPEIDMSGLGGG